MMSDPLTWSIHLGRWAGVQVRFHFFLIAFVALSLLEAALTDGHPVGATAAWSALLLLTLVLHELGHRVAASWRDVEPDDVNLWPLGNLISPVGTTPYTSRSADTAVVALAGPLLNAALALSVAIGLALVADARMVLNPFGNAEGGGAPLLADGKTFAEPFSAVWLFGWFGYLNWVLFLANLIPALPLDNGRALRALLDHPWNPTTGRDGLVGPWTARVSAIILVLVGVIRILMGSYGGMALLALALLIYMYARLEARILDEGGLLDDGIFGYDFSQGYTSLEAGPATVRPRREGVLRRWRRRRSEQRRQRQEARQAAEEQRMDEILAKIHQEGRAALTADEQRFLVRVSARYKNRAKVRD